MGFSSETVLQNREFLLTYQCDVARRNPFFLCLLQILHVHSYTYDRVVVVRLFSDVLLGDNNVSLKRTSKADVRTTTCAYVYEWTWRICKREKMVPTHAFALVCNGPGTPVLGLLQPSWVAPRVTRTGSSEGSRQRGGRAYTYNKTCACARGLACLRPSGWRCCTGRRPRAAPPPPRGWPEAYQMWD